MKKFVLHIAAHLLQYKSYHNSKHYKQQYNIINFTRSSTYNNKEESRRVITSTMTIKKKDYQSCKTVTFILKSKIKFVKDRSQLHVMLEALRTLTTIPNVFSNILFLSIG